MKIDIDKELQETITSSVAIAAAALVAVITQDTAVQMMSLGGILGLAGYKAVKTVRQ